MLTRYMGMTAKSQSYLFTFGLAFYPNGIDR